MGIDIYLSNNTVKKWFSILLSDISLPNEYVVHNSLDTLYSSILNVKTKRLVILDIEDRISIEYFNSMSMSFNNVEFIAIGLNKSIDIVIKLHSIGFKGYIDLNYSTIELYQIISKASSGFKYLSVSQQDELLKFATENFVTINGSNSISNIDPSFKHAIKALTDKEKRVCELLIKGMTYKEIASAAGVTSFTINQRVKSIYKKLDVKSRGELSYRYLG